MIKEDFERKAEINTEIYLKKKKNKKREYGKNRYYNMSKEKKTRTKKISKKLPWGMMYSVFFSHKTLNP